MPYAEPTKKLSCDDWNPIKTYEDYLTNIASCVESVKEIYANKNKNSFKEIIGTKPDLAYRLDFICAIADNTSKAANSDIGLAWELANREHEIGPIQRFYRNAIDFDSL